MALVKATLQADILDAFDSAFNATDNPAAARQQLAAKLAIAIDKYIKAGQVVGSSPSGPVTGSLQ
jgi:hypothetical protein